MSRCYLRYRLSYMQFFYLVEVFPFAAAILHIMYTYFKTVDPSDRQAFSRLVTGWSSCHIAHSVLPLHLPTMSDLHFQSWMKESQ